MKKYIFPALLLITFGCAKTERSGDAALAPGSLTPSETVLKVCNALSQHDSIAYINLVSASRRQVYASNPQMLSRTMAFWSMHKPTIQVISESVHDTIAVVKYRLRISGTQPVDVTDSTQLFLENGSWKYSR